MENDDDDDDDDDDDAVNERLFMYKSLTVLFAKVGALLFTPATFAAFFLYS